MGWKVVVDQGRCEANAVCVGLAPEVFELPDDRDVARVLLDEPDDSLRARVESAVNNCPRAAITIVDAPQ
jgi:ferredoxin